MKTENRGTYKCLECDNQYSHTDHFYDGLTNINLENCPYCGSEDVYEIAECENCGNYFEPDEIVGVWCRDCVNNELSKDYEAVMRFSEGEKKVEININPLLAYIFDKDEIEEILMSHLREAFETKYAPIVEDLNLKTKDYVSDFTQEFAEFLIRKEK